jgi:2-keto-4-pentenoate hydratase/2-oxohepta-3-ene-1,7-dioic acid hydratase in catechol pathway
MRVMTFRLDGALHAGLVDGDRVIEIAADGSLKALIAEGPAAIEIAAAAATVSHALDAVEPQAPIGDPDKIICLGLNYREHAEEFGAEAPTDPIIFAKFRNALRGTGDAIVVPAQSEQIDYEGELAVVIGSRCRDVTAADALDHVFGVMPFNDVTARDLQFRSGQWLPGKMPDSFAPCGPQLVTLDEVGDVQDLTITTRLNGDVVQHESTARMIFSVRDTIAWLSSLITLMPGDIIATGTPSGVGFKRLPPRYLRAGDTVEVEISRVGTLANPVVLGAPVASVA